MEGGGGYGDRVGFSRERSVLGKSCQARNTAKIKMSQIFANGNAIEQVEVSS